MKKLSLQVCVWWAGMLIAFGAPVPNDPQYSTQWNLSRIGVPSVWAVSTGSRDIVVAVIDTGVDYKHPDLQANIWRNPGETGIDANGNDKATNGIDDDGNGYIDDVHGADVLDNDGDPIEEPLIVGGQTFYHGTHIAGIIGAVGNNSLGTTGINWETSIMILRAFPLASDNFTEARYVQSIEKSLAYVLEMKRRGVNVAVTCNAYHNASYSPAIKDLIRSLGEEGVLNIFTAGNDTMNCDDVAFYPGTYNDWSALMIANVGRDDIITAASNYGKSTVDFAALGREIQTIYNSDFRGTSASCAHVAGAIALLKSAVRLAGAMAIRTALLASVDPLSSLQGKTVSNGRINAGRALTVLQGGSSAPIVIDAQPSGPHVQNPEKITVVFSEAMDHTSVESGFQITPAANGHFEWSDDSRRLFFVPANGFSHVRHTVKISGTSLAANGSSLDGNFNRLLQGAGPDDFVWSFDFPLANDDLENAQILEGDTGLVSASNRFASPQTLEPDHAGLNTSGPSVWYQWTAPADMWITFSTTNATFDTILAAYTERGTELLPEAANDNIGANTRSRITFRAVAGSKYLLAVAGKSVDENKADLSAASFGSFQLQWMPTPAPTISSFTPSSAYPGQQITVTGNYFTSVTKVAINGITATYMISTNSATSDTVLTVSVPTGASTGTISLRSSSGEVISAQKLNVLVPPALTLQTGESGTIQISWPETPGFVLQNSELAIVNWSAAQPTVSTVQNGIHTAILPGDGQGRMYRVFKP